MIYSLSESQVTVVVGRGGFPGLVDDGRRVSSVAWTRWNHLDPTVHQSLIERRPMISEFGRSDATSVVPTAC